MSAFGDQSNPILTFVGSFKVGLDRVGEQQEKEEQEKKEGEQEKKEGEQEKKEGEQEHIKDEESEYHDKLRQLIDLELEKIKSTLTFLDDYEKSVQSEVFSLKTLTKQNLSLLVS